jgi:hypothetical protein
MDDSINTLKSSPETITITNITDKESQAWELTFRIKLLKFPLLQFITAINNQALNERVSIEDFGNEFLAKTARTASYKNPRCRSEGHTKD